MKINLRKGTNICKQIVYFSYKLERTQDGLQDDVLFQYLVLSGMKRDTIHQMEWR